MQLNRPAVELHSHGRPVGKGCQVGTEISRYVVAVALVVEPMKSILTMMMTAMDWQWITAHHCRQLQIIVISAVMQTRIFVVPSITFQYGAMPFS
jgi:hypothetical protein